MQPLPDFEMTKEEALSKGNLLRRLTMEFANKEPVTHPYVIYIQKEHRPGKIPWDQIQEEDLLNAKHPNQEKDSLIGTIALNGHLHLLPKKFQTKNLLSRTEVVQKSYLYLGSNDKPENQKDCELLKPFIQKKHLQDPYFGTTMLEDMATNARLRRKSFERFLPRKLATKILDEFEEAFRRQIPHLNKEAKKAGEEMIQKFQRNKNKEEYELEI